MGNTCQGSSDNTSELLAGTTPAVSQEALALNGSHQRQTSSSTAASGSLGAHSGPETLDWLDLLFQSYWSKFDGWAKDFVTTQLKPTLHSALPSFLKEDVTIANFTIGDGPPKFSNGVGQSRSTADARVSFDVHWASNLTLDLAFTHKSLGQVDVGIKSIEVKGGVSVVFAVQTTGEIMEGWGATIYFLDAPEIQINYLGTAHAASLPGIRGILRSVIEEQLSSRVVLPNALNLTFGITSHNADTKLSMAVESPPVGALRVTLLKASGLSSGEKDFFGHFHKSESKYLTFTLGGRKWKSQSIDPDTHHALVVHDLRQGLKIEVWDESILGEDKIGQAGPFNVRDALALSGQTVPLQPNGSLQLHITWLKAKPKQLAEDGCIVCVKLSSITLPLDLGDSAKLHASLETAGTTEWLHGMTGKQRKTPQEAKSRVVNRSESRFLNLLLELEGMGVDSAEIDKLKAANVETVKKMGIITNLYLHAHKDEFASAKLVLTVVVQKGGKFCQVGQPWSTTLADVAAAPDLTCKGPMSFGSSIEVNADIELWGLIPLQGVPE